MRSDTSNSFVESVKPLFRQRRLYRILSGISLFFIVISYHTWFFFLTTAVSIFPIVQLLRIEMSLETKVWERFKSKLDNIEDSTQVYMRAAPLEGVVGSLGDSSSNIVHAVGRYGQYDVRLLTHSVNFNTNSKNGGFSRDYRVLEITTSQDFYHVYIDSNLNNRKMSSSAMNIVSISIRENQKLTVEGDIEKFFTIYVPGSDRFKSLVTLTPEKLLALRDYGTKFDIEFCANKIYLISENKIKSPQDILQYQESIFDVLDTIGIDVIRKRPDIENTLIVKTPPVLVL
jgi:hypothetical protein